jgi:hypothetical protein
MKANNEMYTRTGQHLLITAMTRAENK